METPTEIVKGEAYAIITQFFKRDFSNVDKKEVCKEMKTLITCYEKEQPICSVCKKGIKDENDPARDCCDKCLK